MTSASQATHRGSPARDFEPYNRIHVNETSSSRVDAMPYGGMKESWFGREGPEYAIAEMTEEKVITISP